MNMLDFNTWSTQALTYLLIGLFLAMVLVLVALLHYLRRTRPRPPAAGDEEAAAESAPPPDIIVRRKAWAGRMELVVNGREYRRMKDIDDAETRRAVMLAVGDLVTFAGPSANASRPPDASAAETQTAGKESAPAQMEPPRPPEPQTQAPPASLDRVPGGPGAPAPGSRTFVGEIEQIVQRRRSEKGLTQEIRLQPDSQGIVRVEVDGILYDSPGDIPDLEVRALIRAAVGEWEEGS